jgi:endonuclease YncB( thermonuclease family)
LKIPVQILKVYDGDTLLIKNGNWKQKVRLSRIDAPEKDQAYLSGKKGAGVLAKRCLEQLVQQEGELTIEGFDCYGRLLGDLNHVSLQLVERGCVSLYPYAQFRSVAEKYVYLKSYLKARQMKRGLWAYGGMIQPKAWRKKNKTRKRT